MSQVEQIARGRWLIASAHWGLLAFMIAKGAGVPVWRDWEIGDATDIGFVTSVAVFLTGLRVRQWLMENEL